MLPAGLHEILPEMLAGIWIELRLSNQLGEDPTMRAGVEVHHPAQNQADVFVRRSGVGVGRVDHHLIQECLNRHRTLVRPPFVDRRPADTAASSDLVDGHSARPDLQHQFCCRLEHRFAGLLTARAARSSLRGHGDHIRRYLTVSPSGSFNTRRPVLTLVKFVTGPEPANLVDQGGASALARHHEPTHTSPWKVASTYALV